MDDRSRWTGPAIAFVVLGGAIAWAIRVRGNDGFDTVNVVLIGVLVGTVVLALAIGNWRSR
jgi:hypothetical protein